jgi:hypothetical protein
MKQKSLSVLRSIQNTQRIAITVYNFWILNLVVRKETARLERVKTAKMFLCEAPTEIYKFSLK